MTRPEPSRSPLSAGLTWSARLTSLGLEFALPPLVGHFLDRHWGTEPLATLVGTALGFGGGMFHLLRIARGPTKPRPGASERRSANPCDAQQPDRTIRDGPLRDR